MSEAIEDLYQTHFGSIQKDSAQTQFRTQPKSELSDADILKRLGIGKSKEKFKRLFYGGDIGDVPCERRVGKLWLPPGAIYFGCRHCYGLTYRSCQESHKRDRMVEWILDKRLEFSSWMVKREMDLMWESVRPFPTIWEV